MVLGFGLPYRFRPRAIVLCLLVLFVVLLVAGGLIFKFSGAHSLGAAGKIRFSGSYILTRDIEASGPVAFELRGDRIDLNLNGKTVSCRSDIREGDATIGIEVKPGSFARIYNGSIRGCDIGIHALEAEAVEIRGVDFSGVRYMGIDVDAERLTVLGSKFSRIGGYDAEAYAVGINAKGGEHCHIEGNRFSELYRQENAAAEMTGEGVGVILGDGTKTCTIINNTFENQRLEPNSIGVWVADQVVATITSNMLVGFESGLVGGGLIRATGNVIWLDPPGGNASYGIYGGPGSELSGNLIVGFQNARSIMQQNGELLVIK